jgi:hypothetical protein
MATKPRDKEFDSALDELFRQFHAGERRMAEESRAIDLHRASTDQLLATMRGEEIPFVSAEADPPVICTQAALAMFCGGRSPNTSGLAQKLKDDGTLRHFIPPKRKNGRWQFWFTDQQQHKEALKTISGKVNKRPKV